MRKEGRRFRSREKNAQIRKEKGRGCLHKRGAQQKKIQCEFIQGREKVILRGRKRVRGRERQYQRLP